jgi:hypothetical protein
MHDQRSEVAYLIAQIRNEYAACHQALYGLALGTAQHAFITAKTERLAQHVEALCQVVGEDAVRDVLIHLEETPPGENPQPNPIPCLETTS